MTIGGADCAVMSASNTELECVIGPHTLSDYIYIYFTVPLQGTSE